MDTKLKGSGRYFFTSDTHFGHGNIIKYSCRPFLGKVDEEEFERLGLWDGTWIGKDNSRWRMSQESIDLMDNELLNHINSMVGENDVLWHLGDFAMPGKHNYHNKCREYRDRINCKNVNLIWGNHDEYEIRDLFDKVYDLEKISVHGFPVKIIMCHYAMAVWDGSHKGNIHIYGHSHSEAEPWLTTAMPTRRSMDVGVDNAKKVLGAYRPFTLEELNKLLVNKAGFSIDHHGKRQHEVTIA